MKTAPKATILGKDYIEAVIKATGPKQMIGYTRSSAT